MLNFKFGKKEYVVINRESLKDVLETVLSIYDAKALRGISLDDVTVEDQISFMNRSEYAREIIDSTMRHL